MSAGIWFWFLFALAIILRAVFYPPEQRTFHYIGGDLLWFILIGILGYGVFGSAVK